MKIAILSDIHSNIFALEAVLRDFDSDSVDHIFVAGDIVGYYYWPRQVVEILMADARFICIRGNHENLLEETRDTYLAEQHRLKYGSGYDSCWETLSSKQTDWLFSLPNSVEIEILKTWFSMHHGSPGAVDEYVYPDAPEDRLRASHSARDVTILGHTHLPLLHQFGGKILLNPGSVGQPRDFGGHASYALMDMLSKFVSFRRVPYQTAGIIALAKHRDPKISYLHEVMNRG